MKPIYEKSKLEFMEDGWSKINNFVSSKTIDEINKEVESFIEMMLPNLKPGEYHLTESGEINTIHTISQNSTYFDNLLCSRAFVELAEFILGSKVEPQWAQVFNKPKETGMASPFHQDNYFWNVIDSRTVTLWLALDEVKPESGALSYFTKSHKLGMVEHVPTFAKGTSQGVAEKIIQGLNPDSLVSPSMNPGDLLIHHGLTIHGSRPNLTKHNRRGMSFWYKDKFAGYDEEGLEKYRRSLAEQHEKIYSE